MLHIEDDDEYDMAFFRVEGSLDNRRVISLARTVSAQQRIVVLGYPANDSRVPDQTLMEQIFGSVYDVERFAPGEVMDVIDVDAMQSVTHDCTTLQSEIRLTHEEFLRKIHTFRLFQSRH